jgi:aminoglycoside phosphotransferase (APT) family kinase protein
MPDAPAKPYLDPDSIPIRWEDVTPDWMTAALQSRLPGVKVKEVSIAMADDGTNRRARLALTYAEGQGPATVFVKAHAADHRLTHLRNRNLWNEASLFASGVDLPLDHPLVYKAVIDLLGLDFLLVMEDIRARGADPRDSTRPMTLRQVANAMKGLARLHSRYWGLDPAGDPRLGWLQTWAPTEGWQSGLRRFVPGGLERGRHALPEPVAQMSGDEVVDLWARYVGTLATAPMTLTHGDAHIGNTYVLPDDDVGFLDWQVVRRGRWSQDVGHFLTGALTIEDCARHERELIELYRISLDVPEDQRPSAEAAWLEHRATPVYGLAIWLSTLGAGAGWQPHEISQTLAERFAAAFVRLDTLQALDAIGA